MSVEVRIYSDFVCPFCYIAETGPLEQLAEAHDIEINWRGFELHPETPPGGRALEELFPASRLEGLWKTVQRLADELGVAIDERPTHLPNTRRALAVAEYARDEGRLEAFRREAMDAYWRRQSDLEDEEALRTIGEAAGLDPEGVAGALVGDTFYDRIADIRMEGMGRGVTGVPTFFFGDRPVVGCQPYEVLEETLRAVSP